MDFLTRFIRSNSVLTHLDLTACGLLKDQILQVVLAVQDSSSLQAVHLCMNEGLDTQLTNEVYELFG
jgi:hypothetical protein